MKDDPKSILSNWKLEGFRQYQEPKPEEVNKNDNEWPDTASQNTKRFLERERNIHLPWKFGSEFGTDFKIVGLRAGGMGVVFFVRDSRFKQEKIYAAKTLQRFLQSDYLEKPAYEQKEIAQAFLEEALPWLEMGQHAQIVSVLPLREMSHLFSLSSWKRET
jgi:hypothetical protein